MSIPPTLIDTSKPLTMKVEGLCLKTEKFNYFQYGVFGREVAVFDVGCGQTVFLASDNLQQL